MARFFQLQVKQQSVKSSWNIAKFKFVSYYIMLLRNILIASKKYKLSVEELRLVPRRSIADRLSRVSLRYQLGEREWGSEPSGPGAGTCGCSDPLPLGRGEMLKRYLFFFLKYV